MSLAARTSTQQAPIAPGFELAQRRFEDLYAISKLFASFEDIEHTVDPALAVATKTLLLRSAILIKTNEEGLSRMIVWHSDTRSAQEMAPIKHHVEATYAYLVGASSSDALALSEHIGLTPLPRQPHADQMLASQLIVIPLVVSRQPPFGALQFEGSRPFDKAELMFANAIASQLSIALDRDRARRQDIARREYAEQERLRADTRRAEADQQRIVAESLKEKYEILATENAKLYEQARHAVQMREQILTIVSHDLRNPLNTILMTTQVLDAREPVNERRKELPRAVGRITRAAERMLRLIEDLLDFASIEEGRLAVDRGPEDPGSIVRETCASFETAARAKQIQLTEVSASELPNVYCDRDRILQVLGNIVGNATKSTPVGGQIEIRVERSADALLFTVTDTGPGISEHDLDHLFDRYWRGSQAQYKGSGLGLAIAKGIITAHGGRIWAESKLGLGAKFFVTVPAVEMVASS